MLDDVLDVLTALGCASARQTPDESEDDPEALDPSWADVEGIDLGGEG